MTKDNYDDHKPQTVGVELPSKLDELLDWQSRMMIKASVEQSIAETHKLHITQEMLDTAHNEAKQAINAYIEEKEKGARLKLWHEILGIDFDKFYPEDKVNDFISLPSEWINQHISEDKMQSTLAKLTQPKGEVE